jgi:hypothetical protein
LKPFIKEGLRRLNGCSGVDLEGTEGLSSVCRQLKVFWVIFHQQQSFHRSSHEEMGEGSVPLPSNSSKERI